MAPAPTLDAFLHGEEVGHDQDADSHMMRDPGVRTLHEAMTSLSNQDFHSPRRTDSDTMSPDNQPGGGGGGGSTSSPPGTSAAAGTRKNSNGGATAASAPAWTELKTKAGKDRKRLPLACIACRRKKIRCSGEKPTCQHCVRSRIPCVYKVTTRRPAPRTDYMAMLDKRLKRMEERVIRIIPKEAMGIVASTGRAVVKPNLGGNNGNGKAGAGAGAGAVKKRSAENAFGEELEAWAAEPKPGEDAGKDAADPEKKRQQKLAGAAAEETDLMQDGAEYLPCRELQEHLTEVFFDYVYGQSYHLLHKPSFLRKLAQGTVPPVLMLAVCAVSARFSNHPAVLGWTQIMAEDPPGPTAAAPSQQPQQQQQQQPQPAFLRGEQWARPAREISLRRYDQPSLTILTVYLLLGLHEFGTCHGGRSWMLGGMAQRMAYALQLHKDLDRDPRDRDVEGNNDDGDDASSQPRTFSPTEREIRRRTMWACFLMDRFNSSGTERPIFVGKQYIRAQLPIREEYFLMELTGPTENLEGAVPAAVQNGSSNPSGGQKNINNNTGDVLADARANMGVAAYLIRAVALWGALINYLNLGGQEADPHEMWHEKSKFQEIRRAAANWAATLPADLRYDPDNLHVHASQKLANQFVFLHLVYNQVLLFMNRFALQPSPPPAAGTPARSTAMPESFRAESAAIALAAADQIAQLAREALTHNVVAPFAGYAAFCSSTVHIPLALATAGNPAQAARSKQCLSWNVRYLTQMKRYWGMFHFVSENLREVYRRSVGEAGRAAATAAAGGGMQATGSAVAPNPADGSNPRSAAAGGGTSDTAAGTTAQQRGPEFLQYGDWFERYPHGVAPGSKEEEAATPAKVPPAALAEGTLVPDRGLQTLDEFFLTEQQKQRQQRILVAQQQQQQQQQKGSARKRAASKPESTMRAEAKAATARPRASESPTLVAASGRERVGKGGEGSATEIQQQQQQQRHTGPTVVHDLSSIRAFQSRTSQPTLSRASTVEDTMRPHASSLMQRQQHRPQSSHTGMAVGQSTTLPSHPLTAATGANNLLGQASFPGMNGLNDIPMTTDPNNNTGIPSHILQNPQLDTSNVYAQFDPNAAAAAFNPASGAVNDPPPTNGNDFWGDPATAWFMPFNLEPPDDMSLFGPGGGVASNTTGPGAAGAGAAGAYGSGAAFGGFGGEENPAMLEWSAAFDGGFAGVPGTVFWSPEGTDEAMAVDLDASGMSGEGMDQMPG